MELDQNTALVYQFKIVLQNSNPKIWRRILVPEYYTFWEFHVAIQEAMGWGDWHLHRFHLINPVTGIEEIISQPSSTFKIIREDDAKIAQYFVAPKSKAIYVYDFRDKWNHEVVLEKVIPAIEGTVYPKCLSGKRACPPEEIGGIEVFSNLLDVLGHPEHEKYEKLMERLSECVSQCSDFKPDYFDPRLVKFEDPEDHMRLGA